MHTCSKSPHPPCLSVKIFLLNAPFYHFAVVDTAMLIEMHEGKGHLVQSNYTLQKLIVIENDDW